MDNNGGFETNNLINLYDPPFELEEITDNNIPWYLLDHYPHTPPSIYSSPDADYTHSYDFESGFSAFDLQNQLGVPSFTPDLQFYTLNFQDGSGSSEMPAIGLPNLPPAAVEQPNLVQNTVNSGEGYRVGGGNLIIIDDLDTIDVVVDDDDSALNLDCGEINSEIVTQTGDWDNSGGDGEDGGSGWKGKRKYTSKNLDTERRRRNILKEKLVLLRSMVPKITKMDRASILKDAIAYIKELRQQVNVLNLGHRESTLSSLKLQPAVATGFESLTPATSNVLPSCNKQLKKCVSPHAIKIEVRQREKGVVNIHMFCDGKVAGGLLYSITATLDSLGLEIQEAVFSCFNGFALDVFRAQKKSENHVNPDQIKAKLIESAGCHVVG